MFQYSPIKYTILIGLTFLVFPMMARKIKVKLIEPKMSFKQDKNLEVATLGGGCFWCTEAVYQRLKGVKKVQAGYSGGKSIHAPTYQEVCTGTTGYAEVIHIHYDPEVITFQEILMVFFKTHDPTTLNRQGNDRGTQYRSIIFYHSDNQKLHANNTIQKLTKNHIFENPIVTEVTAFESIHYAEQYHQNYYNQHKNQPYCAAIITPKMAKFEKEFHDKLKK